MQANGFRIAGYSASSSTIRDARQRSCPNRRTHRLSHLTIQYLTLGPKLTDLSAILGWPFRTRVRLCVLPITVTEVPIWYSLEKPRQQSLEASERIRGHAGDRTLAIVPCRDLGLLAENSCMGLFLLDDQTIPGKDSTQMGGVDSG